MCGRPLPECGRSSRRRFGRRSRRRFRNTNRSFLFWPTVSAPPKRRKQRPRLPRGMRAAAFVPCSRASLHSIAFVLGVRGKRKRPAQHFVKRFWQFGTRRARLAKASMTRCTRCALAWRRSRVAPLWTNRWEIASILKGSHPGYGCDSIGSTSPALGGGLGSKVPGCSIGSSSGRESSGSEDSAGSSASSRSRD
jgi:hypothetical protein